MKRTLFLLFLALCLPLGAANLYPVTQPIKLYTDTNGAPLQGGYIWFGAANTNPITNPITMYWDAAGTIPAAQPIRTTNGYISRQGTPANIYAIGDFSIAVQNSQGATVFTLPTSTDLALVNFATAPTAASIPIVDSGAYFTTDNVEAALQQLGPLLVALTTTTPTGATTDYVGTTAPSGWVFASSQTIGDASSGAVSSTHQRANADTSALYTLLWNSYGQNVAILPIYDSSGTLTTYGASASADFGTAHKRLATPDCRGRVRAGKDNMNGAATAGKITVAGGNFDGTIFGNSGGSQNHALTIPELANHNHTATVTDPGHTHTVTDPGHQHTISYQSILVVDGTITGHNVAGTGGSSTTSNIGTGISLVARTTGVTVANTAAGSGTAHTVTQPTIIFNTIIKL